MIRSPRDNSVQELQRVSRELEALINKVAGTNNSDFRGRRIINAGNAKDPQDYVTMADVGRIFEAKMVLRDGAAARRAAQAASIGIYSSGGGGGSGPSPTVPLYDGSSIVNAYAAANPAQLANSCQDTGGTWDFMDGVVAALQAVDSRFGFNGKRGNVNDPSKDAISYYHGNFALMEYGSNAVYVVDIIAGHCGTNPTPAWQDVTTPISEAAWLPYR